MTLNNIQKCLKKNNLCKIGHLFAVLNLNSRNNIYTNSFRMNLITINLCLRNKLNQFKSEKVNHKSYYKNNNNKMKNKKH